MPTLKGSNVESKIFNVLWGMKKNGKRGSTIKNGEKALHLLAENCNLDNSEEIKEFIATFDRKEGYKRI